MAERRAVNARVAGSIPVEAALLPCGVIGNISGFDPEESWFKPRQGSQFTYAPVAQLEEGSSFKHYVVLVQTQSGA